ncbi:unnamed protein product [Echinostoma caproni]|uniref:PH domain-containing protein n=1 Tax=Echinostoma caproni TaxID=27848 RepID=A0A183A8Z2_9TREM|nr:unnamed protein product [Echinostoma caproni]
MHKRKDVRSLSKSIRAELRRLNPLYTRAQRDNKGGRETWQALMRTSGIKSSHRSTAAITSKSKDPNRRTLNTTYLTRSGEIFLYTSAQEVQPWQSQVTAAELNRLADKRATMSKAIEGEETRKKVLADTLELSGLLKMNTEFPSSWLSPARETIPPIAIKEGLSVSEFIQNNRSRNQRSFKIRDPFGFNYEPLNAPHLDETGESQNRNNPQEVTTDTVDAAIKMNKRRALNIHRMYNPKEANHIPFVLPSIELNPSNSCTRASSRLLLSRSSFASETLPFVDGQWSDESTEHDHGFLLNSLNSAENGDADEEDADWSYESTRSSSMDESQLAHANGVERYRSVGYSLDSTMIESAPDYHAHKQINVNAVCPESTIPVAERSASANQVMTPSLTTAATTTTCASSRWSRNTPNPNSHVLYSPNRITPASTPSRKANTQTSLLETAKMLLTESSKLEPVGGTIPSPRDHSANYLSASIYLQKRQREAAELQRQITALDATIERLYTRTREKTIYLNSVVNDTFHQIQNSVSQRAAQRRNKQCQKRKVTSELFLRHFRDRQARKRRLQIKLGLRATKSGHATPTNMAGVLPSALTSKDVDEATALQKWQASEDARDQEEDALATKYEAEAAAKATSRLRWLREVATTQLRHLEEVTRVTHPVTNFKPTPEDR